MYLSCTESKKKKIILFRLSSQDDRSYIISSNEKTSKNVNYCMTARGGNTAVWVQNDDKGLLLTRIEKCTYKFFALFLCLYKISRSSTRLFSPYLSLASIYVYAKQLLVSAYFCFPISVLRIYQPLYSISRHNSPEPAPPFPPRLYAHHTVGVRRIPARTAVHTHIRPY